MTPQQIDAMKLALEALKKCHYYMIDAGLPNQSLLNEAFTAYKALEALKEHAMREVQRLGQEIEQEPLEYWNAVEGWVKIDEVRKHFDSVGCGTIYKSAGEGRVPLCLAQPEQEPVIDGNTSDGYHTFNELYEFRKAYNIALFNEWAANGKCSVHKSWRHNDGELCFGGGWFIVVAVLPQGQISNHYEAKDWDLFHIQETGKALFEFDGHIGADVIERLKSYTAPPQRTWVGLTDEEIEQGCKESWVTEQAFQSAVWWAEAKLKEKNT